ncbi:MAG TPA: L-seryl-tRNA(Sec) selenium transferase [Acidimicrobiales bacterium]|jgi:L-seryl-tRNA(Ser) seleniumtransferase|nr:L-seryl-tRNA(Sec) selenium transferase [Acidimicrobiales bacterium]
MTGRARGSGGAGEREPILAKRPPSVDALARSMSATGLPHPVLVDAARDAIATGDPGTAAPNAERFATTLLRPVINATGVLLHTNLGRAPIAVARRGEPARYANVELDLETGKRGSRSDHAARLLALAAGAEAALVVNNGASAVLLALSALASGTRVPVSRGELVEIGGGFRIPEVLHASGATLAEVGTTNRTRVADYRRAVGDGQGAVGVVLKVHRSNYQMLGFTEDVTVRELATLGVPVVFDIGSGLLDETTPWLRTGPPPWLRGEPAARQALEQGAALVTFSGDKLLGGPQAGVIAGRRDLVQACARHPLARALRPGGLVLEVLQDTALAYLRRDADAIAFWRMAQLPVDELVRRAEALGTGEVVRCNAVPGGGTLPGLEIESAGIALPGDRTAALRRAEVPVIARVHEGRTVLDLRTVDPADDELVADAARAALAPTND